MREISRKEYAAMYGPTTGDRVRLADTSLIVEVEKDYCVYGDEAKFGGGKSLRDGMGQAVPFSDEECLDMVITSALVIDSTGIYKADIGIKDGKISGVGKAGNPQIMDGVTPGMIIGASTEALAGEGLILTAGGIDTHIHFISPTQIHTALYSGVTTMIGGGVGPADGTNATTCTPGKFNIHKMLEASEGMPMNLGYLGKGNSSDPEALPDQLYKTMCEEKTSVTFNRYFRWENISEFREAVTPEKLANLRKSFNPVIYGTIAAYYNSADQYLGENVRYVKLKLDTR